MLKGIVKAAAGLAAALAAFAASAGAREPAALEPFLDGYIAAAMADQFPPAVMVAVATPREAFVKTWGVADWESGAPATPDTLFRIASISKTFIWVSVMMLVDEGKLALDADVNQYLKTIRIPEAFGAPVTLNDLMAHRAGFEDTLGDFFDSKSGRSAEESLIRHMPKRVAPPGARTSYSNWGSDLAAQIVEDVSGVPYESFVRTRILAPLGMNATTMRDPASVAPAPLNDPALDARIASPHELRAGAPAVMTHDRLEPTYAAGAMAMSARDAAIWMRMLLRGGAYGERGERLLSPTAFAVMRARHFQDRPFAHDFAHGFMEGELAGYTAFGHGGSLSGFLSVMTIAPALETGVFVVVNGVESPRLPDAIARAVLEQIAGADSYAHPWRGEVSPERAAAAQTVAGVYLGNRRLHSKFEKVAALGGELRIAARPDGSLVVTQGAETKRFYPVAEDTWSDRGRDRLFAYRDPQGRVVRVAAGAGTNTYERVDFLQSSDGFFSAMAAATALSLTMLLGLWRRLGRSAPARPLGRLVAAGQIVAALFWLGFVGVFVYALATVGAASLPALNETGWPPAALIQARWLATASALAFALAGLAAPFVWTASGWSLWRKAHHTLFAAAGLFALYALYEWRLVLAPMTTV